MANPIPEPPLKEPVVNEKGLVTPKWAAFFRELKARAGGDVALSNKELYAQIQAIWAFVGGP